MSHQDAYVKEDRLNADCLNEAFLWLFKGIDWSAIQFRIDCGWMPATFAAMALLFAWSSEPTLIDRFRSSLKIIEFLFPEERRSKPKAKKGQSKKRKESKHKRPSVSYQAFVKMLRQVFDSSPAILAVSPFAMERQLYSLATHGATS
jgi:hypothetical protein